jgi:serine/threonine-protein kinase
VNDDDRPTEAMDAVFTDPDPVDVSIPSDHDTPRDLFAPGLGHDPTVFDTRLGPGCEVGGYIIDDARGSGAFGVVYAATHPMIGKRAAIKVLKPEVSNNAGVVERFILEARAVNEIGHPNIVDIFAYGTLPDGRQYLVMDLLVGETLSERLGREPLPLADSVLVIDQIASALAAAHAKGIVHRDLKPDNVFLVDVPGSMLPEVKLLDFGIVKLLPSASADAGSSRVNTKTGIVLGTANYMSPEQARNRIDHRTDIYALGVMAFEMLTGRLPYIHDNAIEAMVAHEVDPVPSVLALAPGTPVELAQLTEAMMAKSPDDRPTLAAVRNVLKRMKSLHVPATSAVPMRTLPGVLPAPDAARESRTALPRPPRDSSVAISRDSAPVINPSARAPQPVAPAAMPVKRSRRWPWVLLVLVVLVGGAAAVAYFVYGWPEI